MPANMRKTWMKVHAYLACFFLPFTLLYILTGVLHLFEIHGEVKQTSEYTIDLEQGWPAAEADAEILIERFLKRNEHGPLPDDYYPDYPEKGDHEWFGGKQEVMFIQTESSTQAKLVIKEHSFWQRLLFIHKGIAGNITWFLGLMFGIHLLISVISGVVLVLQMPKIKGMSLVSLSAGIGLLLFILLS